MPLRKHDQYVCEYPDHDGGHAIEEVGGVPNNEGERRPAKLRQVYSAEESDRYADATGQKQQLGAAQKRISHATARFTDRRRKLGEEIPSQAGTAVKKQIPEDEQQRPHRQKGENSREAEHDRVDRFAAEA